MGEEERGFSLFPLVSGRERFKLRSESQRNLRCHLLFLSLQMKLQNF